MTDDDQQRHDEARRLLSEGITSAEGARRAIAEVVAILDRATAAEAERDQLRDTLALVRAEHTKARAALARVEAELADLAVDFRRVQGNALRRAARLARVEALPGKWLTRYAGGYDTPRFGVEAGVGIEHCASDLRAALADTPAPSEVHRPHCHTNRSGISPISGGPCTCGLTCPHVAEPDSRHEDEDCPCVEVRPERQPEGHCQDCGKLLAGYSTERTDDGIVHTRCLDVTR
jgi:hypothetical protein